MQKGQPPQSPSLSYPFQSGEEERKPEGECKVPYKPEQVGIVSCICLEGMLVCRLLPSQKSNAVLFATTVIAWAQGITNSIPKNQTQSHYQLHAQSFPVTISV